MKRLWIVISMLHRHFVMDFNDAPGKVGIGGRLTKG